MCWGEKKVPAVTSVTNEWKEPGQQEVTEGSRRFPSTEKLNAEQNHHAVPEKGKKKSHVCKGTHLSRNFSFTAKS